MRRAAGLLALCAWLPVAAGTSHEPLPATLAETGFDTLAKAPFTPRYPLWSDGMDKRRWMHLPAGTSVDKSDRDRWEFPRGTRVWKEFSRDGRRNETRLIERLADGSWRYATYAWNAAGTEATLAPEDGIPERGIPSRFDCVACHEGARSPILGYTAVQQETRLEPALGYLHGNCGHCHNDDALPALDMVFAQKASDPQASAERTRASLVGRESRFRPHGATTTERARIVLARMRSHDPLTRMPPIGVEIPDERGIAVVQDWIDHLPPTKEKAP
jgi:hypothetical protein